MAVHAPTPSAAPSPYDRRRRRSGRDWRRQHGLWQAGAALRAAALGVGEPGLARRLATTESTPPRASAEREGRRLEPAHVRWRGQAVRRRAYYCALPPPMGETDTALWTFAARARWGARVCRAAGRRTAFASEPASIGTATAIARARARCRPRSTASGSAGSRLEGEARGSTPRLGDHRRERVAAFAEGSRRSAASC